MYSANELLTKLLVPKRLNLDLRILFPYLYSNEAPHPNNNTTSAQPQNGELPYTVRNYTIVGNYRVGFPQWRVMRCVFPETGPPVLKMGDEIYVLGRSQKRGYLVVELNGQQMHLPHHFTELRVCLCVCVCTHA